MQFVWSVYVAAVLSNGRGPALTAVPIVHSERWPCREVPMVSHPSSPSCSRFHIGLTHQHTVCFGNSSTQGGMQHSAGPGNHRLSPRSLAASGGAPAGVWCPRPVSEDPRMAELMNESKRNTSYCHLSLINRWNRCPVILTTLLWVAKHAQNQWFVD